jgi:branched-subunit amino acid aminotransferase/4-amino-4-deoxychorismate lyase
VRGDDSAFAEGRGCYTTARIVGGQPRFAERHVRRLIRDARLLGIGALDEREAMRGLRELGEAAFPDREGVVRLQASRDGEGGLHLVGVARELGPEPEVWSAVIAPFAHEGGLPYGGRKVSNRLLHTLAVDAARAAGAEEALLLDREDRLVEGARSNVFVDVGRGPLRTPPLERGAVAGVAREIALERVAAIDERDVSRRELVSAREIVCVNAVRGARGIGRLDGAAVGDGRPGPWAQRLADALDTGG